MTDYHIILLDDFDWSYVDSSKKEVIKKINSKGLNVLCEAYSIIIIDANRNIPSTVSEILRDAGIHYDSLYYQIVPEAQLIKYEGV